MAGRPPLRPGEVRSVNLKRNADGTWSARAYVIDAGGVRRNPRGSGATEAEAVATLHARARELALDVDAYSTDTPLAVLLEAWLKEKAGDVRSGALRPQTLRIYRDTVRWLKPMAGALSVGELAPARVKRLLDAIESERSISARAQARNALRSALGIAVEADVIRVNPVTSLRRQKHRAKVPTSMTVGQVNILRELVAARAVRSERYVGVSAHLLRWAMEVSLGSGLRVSEVAALRNVDVDLDAGTIAVTGTVIDDDEGRSVRQDELKHRSQARLIQLPDFAISALRSARAAQQTVPARLPEAPALSGRRGTAFHPRNLRRTLREVRVDPRMLEALRTTGLEPTDLTPHLFRRTAATLVAAASGNLEAARALLGHSWVGQTERSYAGAAYRAVGSAVVLEQLLGGERAS